jgi:hypothetical protein
MPAREPIARAREFALAALWPAYELTIGTWSVIFANGIAFRWNCSFLR